MKFRRMIRMLWPVLWLCFAAAPTFAQGVELIQGVKLDAAIRARGELDNKDFNNSTSVEESSALRTRLGLEIAKIPHTVIYLQIEDSRSFGQISGVTDNDLNLGLHQGYVKVTDSRGLGLSAQVGRFEMLYGRGRVISPSDWGNSGRVFDALRLGWENKLAMADLFVSEISHYDFGGSPSYRRHTLFGLYTQWLERRLHLFALCDWDRLSGGGGLQLMQRWSVGTYFQHDWKAGLDVVTDFAYQFGSIFPSTRNLDISAYMWAWQLGYTFNTRVKPRLAVGLDLASGDDGSDPGTYRVYNDLYYGSHRFRGLMDLFISTPTLGLLDLYEGLSLQPAKGWEAAIDLHHFQYMKDYRRDGRSTSAIGQELDATVKCQVYPGLSLQCGASLFFPSEDWRPGGDLGTWMYSMLTASL